MAHLAQVASVAGDEVLFLLKRDRRCLGGAWQREHNRHLRVARTWDFGMAPGLCGTSAGARAASRGGLPGLHTPVKVSLQPGPASHGAAPWAPGPGCPGCAVQRALSSLIPDSDAEGSCSALPSAASAVPRHWPCRDSLEGPVPTWDAKPSRFTNHSSQPSGLHQGSPQPTGDSQGAFLPWEGTEGFVHSVSSHTF